MSNDCQIKGTMEWDTFVGKKIENYKSLDAHKDMTSVTITNVPKIDVLKSILEIGKIRYGARLSEFLLIEYGLNMITYELDKIGLFNKLKLIKRIKRVYQTSTSIPTIDVKFYSEHDIVKGSIVLHMSKIQYANLSNISDYLGFVKKNELALICLIKALDSMLGKQCTDSDFRIYCGMYPKNLSNKLVSERDRMNQWLKDTLKIMLKEIVKTITYYKFFNKEYETGFKERLMTLTESLEILKSEEKDEEEEEFVKNYMDLKKKFKDIDMIINSTGNIETINNEKKIKMLKKKITKPEEITSDNIDDYLESLKIAEYNSMT